MSSIEKTLEVMTYQEIEENKKREDRKRRNRESAAKCRQKLKDKLINSQRVVTREEYRNKALKNEITLVEIELKKIDVILRQHLNHCNFQNYNPFIARNNGFKSHNDFNGITATTSASDTSNSLINGIKDL